jgi:hypothetical protein
MLREEELYKRQLPWSTQSWFRLSSLVLQGECQLYLSVRSSPILITVSIYSQTHLKVRLCDSWLIE